MEGSEKNQEGWWKKFGRVQKKCRKDLPKSRQRVRRNAESCLRLAWSVTLEKHTIFMSRCSPFSHKKMIAKSPKEFKKWWKGILFSRQRIRKNARSDSIFWSQWCQFLATSVANPPRPIFQGQKPGHLAGSRALMYKFCKRALARARNFCLYILLLLKRKNFVAAATSSNMVVWGASLVVRDRFSTPSCVDWRWFQFLVTLPHPVLKILSYTFFVRLENYIHSWKYQICLTCQ